ncbi:MAG: lysophospholipid acyltransferase family protein [Nitrospirales bacterium]|nr:lysophospholipid acyltransferase family protein [Nitrospirales bacterium]
MKLVLLNRLAVALLPPVGASIIGLLGKTMRMTVRGADAVENLYRDGQHIILAFWHGRQLMIPLAYHGREVHILISQHRDGELISRIMSRFGYHSVRGSSTRGGTAALRQLIKLGRSGVDLAITPDGPKGPRYVAQPGTIQLAKVTGLPILPLTFSCSKKNSSPVGIGSWSHTLLDGVSSSGGVRFGCREMPTRLRWKPSAVSWKPR